MFRNRGAEIVVGGDRVDVDSCALGAASKLYVFVADPRSGVDSSPRTGTAYERRLGNVLVHYGGGDRRVLAHVKAAVAALAS